MTLGLSEPLFSLNYGWRKTRVIHNLVNWVMFSLDVEAVFN